VTSVTGEYMTFVGFASAATKIRLGIFASQTVHA
jgi:hypothetical protein